MDRVLPKKSLFFPWKQFYENFRETDFTEKIVFLGNNTRSITIWKGPKSLTLGKSHADDKAQIAQFSTKDAEKFGDYEAMLNSMVAAVDPLLDHAPPSLYEGLKAKITSGIPILKAGLKLGNEASVFYEMMTAPTTKILNKWFESEPLKATLATDACIGAMISPGIIYLTKNILICLYNKIIFPCFLLYFVLF